MSETDDTDVLLLIPPDFFLIPSSDSDDCGQKSNFSRAKFSLSRTVVSDLLTQVNSLESRIQLIESQSDTSNLHSLDDSVYSYSSKQFKKPLTPHKNRRKMSGIRGRFSISTDNLKNYDSSSVQSTPQKPKKKPFMYSLPTTPSTVTDNDGTLRNKYPQVSNSDLNKHSPARSNLSSRYDPSGNSYDSLQMSVKPLKDVSRSLTLDELHSRYESASAEPAVKSQRGVTELQKPYVPEMSSEKCAKHFTDNSVTTDADADESSVNTSTEKPSEQSEFLNEIDSFLRNVKIIQNHLTHKKHLNDSVHSFDYNLYNSPEFKAIARMQIAESVAIRDRALSLEKIKINSSNLEPDSSVSNIESSNETIQKKIYSNVSGNCQNIPASIENRSMSFQQEGDSQVNRYNATTSECTNSTLESQKGHAVKTNPLSEKHVPQTSGMKRHIIGGSNENPEQNVNPNEDEILVKNHQRTIDTLLQALQDKQNELLELQKKTKVDNSVSQTPITDKQQIQTVSDSREADESKKKTMYRAGDNIGSVPDYGFGMRNIMHGTLDTSTGEQVSSSAKANLKSDSLISGVPIREPLCVKKHAYNVGEASGADTNSNDMNSNDHIYQSGDGNTDHAVYDFANRARPIGEDNRTTSNNKINKAAFTDKSQSGDFKRTVDEFNSMMDKTSDVIHMNATNVIELHKKMLRNENACHSQSLTNTQESDLNLDGKQETETSKRLSVNQNDATSKAIPDSYVLKILENIYGGENDFYHTGVENNTSNSCLNYPKSSSSEPQCHLRTNRVKTGSDEINQTNNSLSGSEKNCEQYNQNSKSKHVHYIPSQCELLIKKTNSVQTVETQTDSKLSLGNSSSYNGSLLSLSELWGQKLEKNNVFIENESSNKATDQKLKEERFRRQHCEKLIEALQARLLESQEKLAVALKVDMAKDEAINKLRDSCLVAVKRYEKSQLECNELAKELEKIKSVSSEQVNEANKKVQHYENELSKALEVARSSQTQAVDSQKQVVILKMDIVKAQDEKKVLAENIQRMEKESSKDKKLLSDSRQSLITNKKTIEASQCEIKKLQEEKAAFEKKYGEEQKKVRELESQKNSLQKSYDELKTNEKKLQTEIQNINAENEKSKIELRAFYQRQVESVVKEKLQQFQSQLEAAEKALQGQIEIAQLQVARTAAQYMQETIEKYQLEIHLLEQRHAEEIRLHVLKLAETEKNMVDMKSKLKSYNTRKVQLAKQLHSLMEAQWKEALKILTNNGQSPGMTGSDAELKKPDSSADIQKLLALHINDDIANIDMGPCVLQNYPRPHSAPQEKPTSDRNKQDVRDKKPPLHSGTSYNSLISETSEDIPFSKDGQQTYRKNFMQEQVTNDDTPVSSRSFRNSSVKENELQKYIKMLLERSPGHPVIRNEQQINTVLNETSQSPGDESYETPTWQPVTKDARDLPPTHYTAEKIKLREAKSKPPWK